MCRVYLILPESFHDQKSYGNGTCPTSPSRYEDQSSTELNELKLISGCYLTEYLIMFAVDIAVDTVLKATLLQMSFEFL